MGEESILIVDRGNGGAILLRSIAVGIIAIGPDQDTCKK